MDPRQTIYTDFNRKATITAPRLRISDINGLIEYIQRYKPAADGSYTCHPKMLCDCTVNAELDDEDFLFSVRARRTNDTINTLIVEAIDTETGKAVDLIYNAEARDFITHLRQLQG